MTTDNKKPEFTQAQSEAMYAFIRKVLNSELVEHAQFYLEHSPNSTFKMVATAREIVNMTALLSAIDSAPAAPLPESGNTGKRKVIPRKLYSGTYMLFFEDTDDFACKGGYATPTAAQAAADSLNAENGVQS